MKKNILSLLLGDREVSYEDANTRLQETGTGDIASHRRDIAAERIRDGTNSASIILPLRRALDNESSAKKKLGEAQRERDAAVSVQRAWEVLVEDLEKLQGDVARAGDRIQSARDKLLWFEQYLSDYIGAENLPIASVSILECSINVQHLTLAIPLMVKAAAGPREKLDAHVATTRQFGLMNGVPKDILATLP